MRTFRSFAAARPEQRPTGAAPTSAAPVASASAGPTKLLLVNFRSGEAVAHHPELSSYLSQGWRVKSAVPRLVETGGTKLLVVLTRPAAVPEHTA